ncbi:MULTISPECIES: phage exclusion protein Lit family protein [unclassified Flavobacterium]|nr:MULTISPECIES: phage exclusion protein Lit family protein [unclassified Flavobacterium]KOP38758.1 hypothetical protein AKO67_06870 [Flavobacterium sp. VMW]OWU92693.1 hypothetical protein APR43_01135 [Flavobacterium sp. NLM]
MKWIFQKNGEINHYKEKIHFGTQPVRVLHHMIVFIFQNTHVDFEKELTKTIAENGISKKINIIYGEQRIKKTPYIKFEDRAIYIEESFLSYLWCICHALYTIYLQKIDFPKHNLTHGREVYKIDDIITENAYELFRYAKFLIVDFEEWDKENLPNPEKYLAEIRDYVEQPNCFYTEANKFILCHEYVHAVRHIDDILENNYENSHFIEFEKEADFEAIEMIKKGIFPSKINELPIQIGITLGLLSMFFFKATTTGTKHPNTEDRLVSALTQLNLNEDSECWGLALLGLEFWAEQFGLNLKWNKELKEKKAFEDFVEQIKHNT